MSGLQSSAYGATPTGRVTAAHSPANPADENLVFKRAHPRKFIAARVQALYDDSSGKQVVTGAMFEDISAGGGSIRLPAPLKVGTPIVIQWLSSQFQVTIMHCRPDGQQFIVGFQKAEDQEPWPTERRLQSK
jgi:PilZ domain